MVEIVIPSAFDQDRSITPEQYIQFCEKHNAYALSMFGVERSLNFLSPGDLEEYWKAIDWWPKDAPKHCMAPHLNTLAGYYVHTLGTKIWTFNEALMSWAVKVTKWLEEEGRSVVNPNESKEERKARKNREAQKRHRERQPTADPAIKAHADHVLHLWQVYLQLCSERKASDEAYKQRCMDALAAHAAAKANPITPAQESVGES